MAVCWQRRRRIILLCSQSEQGWAPEALHLHGPSPHGKRMAQTTRQEGLRTWGHTLVSAILGDGGGCRSTENLSTAAEMGGAGRREGGRYAPADALPESPESAR